jgi:hypothetical protein
MKRKEPAKLSNAMLINSLKLGFGEEVYKHYLKNEIAETILPKILGKTICNYFTEIKNKDGIMTIKVNSAALKSNLVLQRTNLIKRINAEIGSQFVNNIVFL